MIQEGVFILNFFFWHLNIQVDKKKRTSIYVWFSQAKATGVFFEFGFFSIDEGPALDREFEV